MHSASWSARRRLRRSRSRSTTGCRPSSTPGRSSTSKRFCRRPRWTAVPERSAPLDAQPYDLGRFEFTDFTGKKRNLAQFLEDQHIDALVLWSHGKLRQEIYRNGETARTRHLMMSVTKSFTGLVAEMLIAEGKLDETKQITDYVPELKGSAYDGATLRNLMNMEIGIDFSEIYDDPNSTIFQFSYAAGFRPVPPGVKAFPSLYEFLPSLRKKGEHGKDFHYVTANSEVLGWVIEKVQASASRTCSNRSCTRRSVPSATRSTPPTRTAKPSPAAASTSRHETRCAWQ